MDAPKSQTKLARTHSSLLRSSPTVRSSIHSLSSINEMDYEDEPDIEEQKPHGKPGSPMTRRRSTRFVSCIVVFSFSIYTCFLYFRRDDIPTSENLLLVLIFVAVALFFAGKNKGSIHHTLSIIRQIREDYRNRLGLSKTHHKPVQWFIGESMDSNKERKLVTGEGKFVREGVEFYSTGDFYEGEFHKGRCNGSGVYNYFANGRYEGDWIDGKYDGYGIENWSRGSRYKGQYRQGLRHGFGFYRFFTGDTYAGEWYNGQSHGVGAQTCSDGSCYLGEFKCAVKHGLGCYHFRNGDKYAGEYFGDKIHGFGVYHFANGHCYEGSWHEGRRQGCGMYTFRNGGDKRCGEWDSGSLKTPLSPLTDTVLRAVQGARKAAQNAIHLRRVDEQVNKAVMSANRAATAARVAAVKAVQNRMDGKFCDTDI
ncbi:phosphatidylinositol 4-phosphate 5-kinase 4-like [Impatiens glandulifera]|uniref:phosphatidylinositol 4-phosphate 5-kinase 4-like n=1 Tax=Impatiens glandulifera TaxID=253017 RepID=UPI001FB0BAC0|nr:phosphatidylinositol 4-phosphate 5-kinase 4-like [Impatiens glandulifera]